MNAVRALVLLALGVSVGGFTASAFAVTISANAPIPAPDTTVVALDGAVNVCGTIVRWTSDGRTQVARLTVLGGAVDYRFALSYATASADLGGANQAPFLLRISGRRSAVDDSSNAIEVVDARVTRVASCYERIQAVP